MENVEVFLKFDPRYGDAETLDRRVFDAALEHYSYFHGKGIADMTKEDAYDALLEYRDYTIRERIRWSLLEHKVRSIMHDDNAYKDEEPAIVSLRSDIKDLSLETIFQILHRDQFMCRYCGVPGSKEELEIDFIVPPSEGGSLDIDNLVTACMECKNKVLLARSRPKPARKAKRPKRIKKPKP